MPIREPIVGKGIKEIEVWFNGTTAVKKGQAFVYDSDYGTATDADGTRRGQVILPTSAAGETQFAGTALESYPAVTRQSGQMIRLAAPGGYGYALLGADTVVGQTYLTYTRSATATVAGYFVKSGTKVGRGTIRALQTVTAVRYSDFIGTGASSSTTLTDAGNLGTAITTGDKCIIVGSPQSGTVTPGEYTCTQVAGTDTTTLSSAPGNGNPHYFITPATPLTCYCYLFDGEEDGGMEFLSTVDNAASQNMVGGLSWICGGATFSGGDATSTLADGTYQGETKAFKLGGGIASNVYKLTATSALQADQATQLATAEFDGDGDELYLEWLGTEWVSRMFKGVALA